MDKKVKCNTCEFRKVTPLYKGICTKVVPEYIFTEGDRQEFFSRGQEPDWCPLKPKPSDRLLADEEQMNIALNIQLKSKYTTASYIDKLVVEVAKAQDAKTASIKDAEWADKWNEEHTMKLADVAAEACRARIEAERKRLVEVYIRYHDVLSPKELKEIMLDPEALKATKKGEEG